MSRFKIGDKVRLKKGEVNKEGWLDRAKRKQKENGGYLVIRKTQKNYCDEFRPLYNPLYNFKGLEDEYGCFEKRLEDYEKYKVIDYVLGEENE